MDSRFPQETLQKPTFMQKYKLTIISLFIIILAAIPLLLLSNSAKNTHQAMTPTSPAPATPTPTVVPLTPQNADTRLQQNDQDIQQSLNQASTDVNAAAQVDSTQDSTIGL